jgi:hypothetical protein
MIGVHHGQPPGSFFPTPTSLRPSYRPPRRPTPFWTTPTPCWALNDCTAAVGPKHDAGEPMQRPLSTAELSFEHPHRCPSSPPISILHRDLVKDPRAPLFVLTLTALKTGPGNTVTSSLRWAHRGTQPPEPTGRGPPHRSGHRRPNPDQRMKLEIAYPFARSNPSRSFENLWLDFYVVRRLVDHARVNLVHHTMDRVQGFFR